MYILSHESSTCTANFISLLAGSIVMVSMCQFFNGNGKMQIHFQQNHSNGDEFNSNADTDCGIGTQ